MYIYVYFTAIKKNYHKKEIRKEPAQTLCLNTGGKGAHEEWTTKWHYPRKFAQVQINNSHGLKEITKNMFPLIQKLKEKDIRIKEEIKKTER